MKRRPWLETLVIVCVTAGNALATPIEGEVNIAGSFRLSDEAIDFSPTGGGTGSFVTVHAGTGYFSTIASPNLASPYLGTVKDLGVSPSSTTEFLSSFTAPGYAGLSFDLDGVVASTAAPCTGSEGINSACSLGFLTVTNLGADNTALAFVVNGSARDSGIADSLAAVTGRFTTQTGRSISDTMVAFAGEGIEASYSANFGSTAAAPEPGFLWMLGIGLAATAFVRRGSALG